MGASHDVVICGAGIAGISAAYYLAQAGIKNILLIDERPPLTLTSDRSTECYRNWWPDPAIMALMNHSIDLLEDLALESGNTFHMNRRGYLYVSGDENTAAALHAAAVHISESGGGPLRIHESRASTYTPPSPDGREPQLAGADLLLGGGLVRSHFPYLTEKALAALHVRRAGWLSAQQLGMYLLDRARSRGVALHLGRVEAVSVSNGRVRGFRLGTGEHLEAPIFVNAAGPYLKPVGALVGAELPVSAELHLKVAFRDHLGVVPRDAPLLIWNDAQLLAWQDDEMALLNSDVNTRWLTALLPAGAHARPEGPGESQTILMLWDYKDRSMEPEFPPPVDPQYPEIVLRGLTTMLPGLRSYFGRTARPQIDAGYYVKTPENRLLAGPLPADGAFVLGGLSGYGIMAACAAGELLAAHITGGILPSYAPAFSLERYSDPAYPSGLEAAVAQGQL